MSDLQKPSSSAPYLLKLISESKLDPKSINTHQRRICVRYLLQQHNHTQVEIAAILKVPEAYVSRDKRKIQNQNLWMIDELDERKIAVDIVQTAEVASHRLFRKGKEKEGWEVRKQAIEVLQNLGYLKRAPIEIKGELNLQEILKLANGPEDETLLSEGTGRSGKGVAQS